MKEDSEKELLAKALTAINKGKKFDNPSLIVLMGLPGSGKSYVANYLHDKYGYTVLSGENITYSLFGTEKCSGTEYAIAYKILRLLARDLFKQGYSIVIDGTNLKYEFRKQIYDEINSKSTYLIYIITDDSTALHRIKQRGEDFKDKSNIKSSISSETYSNFKSQLELPYQGESNFQLVSDEELLHKIDKIIIQIK